MKKIVFGISFIIILVGIMIYNTFAETNEVEDTGSNLYDVTGDTSVSGGMIAPAESVGIQPGEIAPDFELETLDGAVVKLSELKGEKVILNFWATWCPPCKEEMPEMQEFYDKYGDDINVIAVNFKEKNDKVAEFLNEYGYTFPSPLDSEGLVGHEYGVLTLPTTYFINSDGVIQEPRHVGPMTYEFMEEMLHTLN
ncbi:TlpA family protein disulfide reductase [Oceanobacillus luteolus]|uniref:TlpA family protein disulfide reductase n=1 Tax=Oceanobacillus luteolus TaxID=1274358 RepID=UPI00203E95BD|nr:TlpA family protein disulfide reductase [Oceanobacillus luteolus]